MGGSRSMRRCATAWRRCFEPRREHGAGRFQHRPAAAVLICAPDAGKRIGRRGRAAYVAALPRRRPLDIRSPRAFATTIVTRLCLDRSKSARMTREAYIGPWLPEPVLTSRSGRHPTPCCSAPYSDARFPLCSSRVATRAGRVPAQGPSSTTTRRSPMLGHGAPNNSRQLLHRANTLGRGRPRGEP